MDANFNRSKEGLRVCEDVCRYVLNEQSSTRKYKAARHQLTEIVSGLNMSGLIRSRNIMRDIGRRSTEAEFKRHDAMDIYFANSQRVKESIRVLEEFMKLRNKRLAEKLKKLRYRVYALEKTIIERC
jgi:thiamine-phosphate pyrophosphorylase